MGRVFPPPRDTRRRRPPRHARDLVRDAARIHLLWHLAFDRGRERHRPRLPAAAMAGDAVSAVLVLLAPDVIAEPLLRCAAASAGLAFRPSLRRRSISSPVFPWLSPSSPEWPLPSSPCPLSRKAQARRGGPATRPVAPWLRGPAQPRHLPHPPAGDVRHALAHRQLTLAGASVSTEERPFVDACRAVCVSRGGEESTCVSYCACTSGELKKAGIWESVLGDTLTPQERERLGTAMQVCVKGNPGVGLVKP